MLSDVSRTISHIASLATLSLFATALILVVGNGVRLNWDGKFCASGACTGTALKSPSLIRSHKPMIAIAVEAPIRGT